MKRILPVAATLLLLNGAAGLCCECREVTVDAALRSADAVFVGKVVRVTPVGSEQKTGNRGEPIQGAVTIDFHISETYKGVSRKGDTVSVLGHFRNDMCDVYWLDEGKTYVVFAQRTATGQLVPRAARTLPKLQVGQFCRFRFAEIASEQGSSDLTYLRRALRRRAQ
jgi:hypothetical protein